MKFYNSLILMFWGFGRRHRGRMTRHACAGEVYHRATMATTLPWLGVRTL